MLEEMEVKLRLLAISNMLMAMLGVFLFIRYPFPGAGTNFNVNIAIISGLMFIFDYFVTVSFLRKVKSIYLHLYGRSQKFLHYMYIILSLLARLVIFATANFIIPPIPGHFLFVTMSSFMFGFIILSFRSLPLSVRVKTRLLVIFILNLFTVLYILNFVLDFSLLGINIGYIVIFGIAAFFKGVSLVFSSFVFFFWSTKMPSILSDIHKEELYPEEKEVDYQYPSY